MKSITYQAPAKVILSGEHAVVYGKPALATAIDKKLTVRVFESLHHPKLRVHSLVIDTVCNYLGMVKTEKMHSIIAFDIVSDIPIGRGLGSSAAFSAACSAGLIEFLTNTEPKKDDIGKCAYMVEKIFHTNPSGVDTAASCFGGLIYYRKEFEFLKTISRLSTQIPYIWRNNLYLVDSGKPKETTAEMVQLVRELYNKRMSFTDKLFLQMEQIAKHMVLSITNKDISFFKEAILENQFCLEKLGVVSKSAHSLIRLLHTFGVSKITGAGGKKEGSGYILFYASDKKKAEQFMKDNGISYFQFIPVHEGVKRI